MYRFFIVTTIIVVILAALAGVGAASPDNAQGPKAHTTVHVRGPLATTAPTGLSPTQIYSAYNLTGSGGSGTIAIIDAYDDPNVSSDLNAFSAQFGLPAPNFEKHMMATSITPDYGWGLEISLDVQWAHAVAPNAKILLVEARSASITDLLAAVDYARGRSDVVAISMSWGAGEFSGETSYDSHFTSTYPMTFFASAGDTGGELIWPAASANVVSVGGTTLNFSGGTVSETAWSGSGGGVSKYVTEPAYQVSYGVPGANGKRCIPDVSYDADPNSGVSVLDSYVYGGWLQVGGTSAGAPQWAAIQSLGLSSTNNNFYQDGKNSNHAAYFRDIISGSNGHPAAVGYDLVTGLGSPLTTNFAPVTTPDFTVSASPTSRTVVQGSPTSYNITITPLNGFNGSVTLSQSGLPTGAIGTFTTNPTTSSTSLSVTTAANTTAGTYPLTITGVSGTLTRTANATLVVTGVVTPSFSLSASPTSRTISRGNSATYTVSITRTGGFTGTVTLSVSGLPSQATGTFSSNPATNSSTLTVRTSNRTSRGTYGLTIKGVGGGLTKTTTMTLTVR